MLLLYVENHALTTYIQQACYGNGFEDYLIPTCKTGEKIYVYDVFVYAKRKELKCPQIATYFDRNITYCCNYVNEKEDCGQRYFGTSSDFEHAHYSRCSGMATCSGIPVAWNYTEHFCDISIFAERTNYMKMWYSCIPGEIILTFVSNFLFFLLVMIDHVTKSITYCKHNRKFPIYKKYHT